MKKLNFIVVFSFLLSINSFSQNTMQAFFENKVEVTFLGYDFTQARFIGAEGFTEPEKIKNSYLPALNSLILQEEKKFSIRESFRIKSSNYNTSVTYNKEINKAIDVASIIIERDYSIDKNDLQEIIKNYDYDVKNGIGITYLVESLNKPLNKASVYIVFVDLTNNKVLHAEKVEGTAKGFGWRNFWAGAMYSINKDIKKKYYNQISKQYM